MHLSGRAAQTVYPPGLKRSVNRAQGRKSRDVCDVMGGVGSLSLCDGWNCARQMCQRSARHLYGHCSKRYCCFPSAYTSSCGKCLLENNLSQSAFSLPSEQQSSLQALGNPDGDRSKSVWRCNACTVCKTDAQLNYINFSITCLYLYQCIYATITLMYVLKLL